MHGDVLSVKVNVRTVCCGEMGFYLGSLEQPVQLSKWRLLRPSRVVSSKEVDRHQLLTALLGLRL